MSREPLHMHEEMLLLSLHDDAGTSLAGGWENVAMAGAAFAELVLEGRLRVSDDKKHMVDLVDGSRTGNEFLDECLTRIRQAKRRARASTWVGRLAQSKDLRHRVARDLCRRGVLRADEDKVLFLFTRKIYPEVDPKPEREIQSRLEQAIFGRGPVDPRTAVLVSLADSIHILKPRFEKARFKKARKRLEAISEGTVAGTAAHEAVQAAQAAAMTAIMASIVATTVVTSATSH